MNKIATLLSFLMLCLGLKAQPTCVNTCDTFYYIRVTIFAENAYPIFVSGLSKQKEISSVNLQNIDSLQNSFLRHASFTPSFTSGSYWDILNKCMGDTASKAYAIKHKYEPYTTINKIEKKNVVAKKKLLTGETVQFKITKIAGTFFELAWDDIKDFSNSNQMEISAVNKTEKVLFPFEICLFEKPNK